MRNLYFTLAMSIAIALAASCSKKAVERAEEAPPEAAPVATGTADLAADLAAAPEPGALDAEGEVALEEEPAPAPADAAAAAGKGTVWCDQSSKTNVRAQPNTTAPVVDVVWQNNDLQVYAARDGWVNVKTPNHIDGWIFGAFVDAKVDGACGLAQSGHDGVIVRPTPGPEGDIGMKLSKDDRVCIVEKSGDWSRLIFPDGKSGWVEGRLLQEKN